MSEKRFSWVAVCLIVLIAAPAFGGGFVRFDGSPRGNVIGGGLIASADDPSALYYNPSGITQLKGTQALLGSSLIKPESSVDTPGIRTNTEKNGFSIPFLYMTQQINETWWFGFGVFSRFGLGTEFNQAWPGRFNSYRAKIKEGEANPNIAWRINDKVSVAAGLSIMWFDLSLSRKLPAVSALGVPETDLVVSGDSKSWGWNLSAQYKPTNWLQLGLSYRSKVEHSVKGTAITNPASALYAHTSVSGDVTLPDMILFGINTNLTETLSLGGGVFWTGWQSYDKLQINFGQAFPRIGGSTVSTSQKHWKNVARYLIGTEWKATPHWDFRLGYAFDEAPQPEDLLDYVLPENDRHMMSLGLGYHKDAWGVDLSYTYMIIRDRSVTARLSEGVYNGQYTDASSHLLGLSITRRF